MADIEFKCPACTKSLVIDAKGASKMIKCPDCGAYIQVPQNSFQPKQESAKPEIKASHDSQSIRETGWHYTEKGTSKGPVAFDFLVMLVQDGKLMSGDLVWNAALGEKWVKVGKISGLVVTEPSSNVSIGGGIFLGLLSIPLWGLTALGFSMSSFGVIAIFGVFALAITAWATSKFTGKPEVGQSAMFVLGGIIVVLWIGSMIFGSSSNSGSSEGNSTASESAAMTSGYEVGNSVREGRYPLRSGDEETLARSAANMAGLQEGTTERKDFMQGFTKGRLGR